MRVVPVVAVSLVAALLFCQGLSQHLPLICHESPAGIAGGSLESASIQSVTTEDMAGAARTSAEAIPTYVPNDSYFDKQWAFEKVRAGQAASDNPEILVAILDTGIDLQHEDLAGKVVAGVNLTGSPTASDILGHGTHVAGIIAAAANNGIGIAGLAPNSRLLNVKAADDSGMVWPSEIARGIVWAVDNGARIINMSLVVPAPSPALEEAVDYAWSRGVVLIAAAGNDIKSIPVYPACYPNVIAVAATDTGDRLWTGSNYGDWVDVYAPGVEIYSTLPGNEYGYKSGTSMAAACVTAAAALSFTTVTDVNGDGFLNDEVTDALEALFGMPEFRFAPNPKS